LGPQGNTIKRLQEETGAKISVLGKGSMRDKSKVTHTHTHTHAHMHTHAHTHTHTHTHTLVRRAHLVGTHTCEKGNPKAGWSGPTAPTLH